MRERLQRYGLLRLFVVFVVVAAGYGTRWLTAGEDRLGPFVALAVGMTLVVVAANRWSARRPVGETFAYLQLACDIVFASLLCTLTGSVYSLGQLVYLGAIGASAWLLGLPGAMVVATMSSVGFGLVLLGAPDERLADTPDAGVIFYSEAMFRVFGFYLMGGVTGFAAESLRREQRTTALLSSEHETVLERVSAGVLTTNAANRVVTVNPAGRLLVGDVTGHLLSEVIQGIDAHPEDGERWEEARPDGVVWMCSVASLQDGGKVVVIDDTTELAKARREAALAEHFQGVARFAGTLAHEVRNPLASLSGCLQMIAEDHPSRLAGLALEEAERLNRLVETYLQLTREPPFEPRESAVHELLHGVAETFGADSRYKDTVRVLVDAPPITFQLDPDRLRQAIWNLLLNGAQAMPRGGVIHLSATDESMTNGPLGLTIRVRDEGVGIAPEDRDRVFDPFFTTRVGGSGMGLALVHQILRQHGGRIDVRAPATGGTEFVLWFPEGGADGG